MTKTYPCLNCGTTTREELVWWCMADYYCGEQCFTEAEDPKLNPLKGENNEK